MPESGGFYNRKAGTNVETPLSTGCGTSSREVQDLTQLPKADGARPKCRGRLRAADVVLSSVRRSGRSAVAGARCNTTAPSLLSSPRRPPVLLSRADQRDKLSLMPPTARLHPPS